MVSLLTDLVKTYVEKLIDGVIAESRYVCCFTSIAEEFKEEQARLEAERRTVEQLANEARRSGNDIAANARHWEGEADQLLQEDTETKKKADELIQEDIETKKKCFFGFCPDCVWRYKRGKDLANKIVKMKQLVGKGEKFKNIEIPRPLPDVERYSSQHYISFKGRESKHKQLLEALKDETNFITGLHGMGGAGKTTLAIEVGKELKQSKKFDLVIDTTVSNPPNIKKIQDDIAVPLGLKLEDCNESARPIKLQSRLTNGEKILVILDDVWDQTPLDFNAIGIPKQDNHNGCRLLVTTRNKRVLNKMGCDEIIELEVLSEEDSRIMFQRYADITNDSTKSLIDKGHKIADECKGLPVAIAAVAGSLKGQESLEEWDVALKSLQTPLSSIQGVDDESVVEKATIYNCLKVSYNYLKDEKAKGLFLLCSVFPEDEEIPIETLTRLGIGAGLFGEDYDSYNDARNQVVRAKNKLRDSCLLLEAEEGSVKMHDLVREVAQWIANQEIRTINMSHKVPKSLIDREKNTKYLFCQGKAREMFSSSFGGSKLEILIASLDDRDCVEVPNSFFENMVGLRALHLGALHLGHKWSFYNELALSLPRSIQSLMNIRSLLVSRVDLGDISVLGNLQCLETLDLDCCKITELPHEITKLEKFKLLKLEDCEIKRNNPFEVIGRCISLEELYFQGSFNNFCREINFPKLKRYVVSTEKAVDVSVSKYVVLLGNENVDIFSEATLKYFIQTTELLVLESIKWRWRNIIPEIVPVDQGMNDLVNLYLSNISELQYLIKVVGSRVPNVFSKLVVLFLIEMENLEELCNGPISFDSLKALEELRICSCKNLRSLFKFNLNLCSLKRMTLEGCPLLVSLFQLSTAKSLIMLEELEIKNCEQLESIITDKKRGEESKEEILVDDGGNDNKKHSSMFPKLKALIIHHCPLLEFILPFVFPESGHPVPLIVQGSSPTSSDGFKAPTQLDPIKCNVFSWTHKCCYGLKYKHKLRSTTSTKIPLVSKDQPQHCPISSELSGNVEHFLALEELQVKNSKVENVFFLDEINGQQLNLMLQKIKLQDLHVMTYLFVGPKSSVTLQNLTKIEIERCEKLEIIFSTSVVRYLPQLRYLRIEECKELKHIIEDDVEDDVMSNSLPPMTCFPKLEKLVVVNCNKLEFVFPASICKELHKLKVLMIREADALQEIFKSKDAQNVEIPSLKAIVFVNLPSLSQTQAIQFQNVEHRLVKNCQKLSLTSVSTGENNYFDWEVYRYIKNQGEQLPEDSEAQDIRNENPSAETTKDFATGIEAQATSEYELSSSQELLNKESTGQQCLMSQQHLLGETDTTNKPSERNNCLEEIKDQSIQEASASEKDITSIIMSTNSETRSKPPTQFVSPKSKQESFKTSVEKGTTLDNGKTITSSTQLESISSSSEPLVTTSKQKTSSQEEGDGKTSTPSRSTSETNDQKVKDENLSAKTSKDFATGVEVQEALGHELSSSQELLNEPSTSQECLMSQQHPLGETDTTLQPSMGNNVKTVTSSTHLESINSSSGPLITSEHKTSPQFKDDEIRVSEPKPSPTTSSPASQSISTPYEGNPSQIMENPSSSSLITWELQQLVSKKHLASENLSLLTDFLVKHPSVHLRDNTLSNRYKGYAYNCLAELLKFLQTHSVLNVLESSRSEFVELLQDARRFDFDKDWLDGVEKRVLFPDLHLSQDALEKLLHSKQQVSQHVEDLKNQLTSSEADLESIIQQEAQVLKSRVALSAPIGY